MNEALGRPIIEGDGVAVARVELDGPDAGTIHLGRNDRGDLYYELFKYRFWPADWRKDEAKWRLLADEFAVGAQKREP